MQRAYLQNEWISSRVIVAERYNTGSAACARGARPVPRYPVPPPNVGYNNLSQIKGSRGRLEFIIRRILADARKYKCVTLLGASRAKLHESGRRLTSGLSSHVVMIGKSKRPMWRRDSTSEMTVRGSLLVAKTVNGVGCHARLSIPACQTFD